MITNRLVDSLGEYSFHFQKAPLSFYTIFVMELLYILAKFSNKILGPSWIMLTAILSSPCDFMTSILLHLGIGVHLLHGQVIYKTAIKRLTCISNVFQIQFQIKKAHRHKKINGYPFIQTCRYFTTAWLLKQEMLVGSSMGCKHN